MSDRGGDDSVSVVPVQEGIIVNTQVVADLRETRTALVNWMPGRRERERERERSIINLQLCIHMGGNRPQIILCVVCVLAHAIRYRVVTLKNIPAVDHESVDGSGASRRWGLTVTRVDQ